MLKNVISPALAIILVSSILVCPYAREQFHHEIVGFSFTASPQNMDLGARAFSHLMTLADHRLEPIAVLSPETLRINPYNQDGEGELSEEKITSVVPDVFDTQKGFLSPLSILGPIRWVFFLIRFIGRVLVDLVSVFEADFPHYGTSGESSSSEHEDHHQIVAHHLGGSTEHLDLYNNPDAVSDDSGFSGEDGIDHGLIVDRDLKDFVDTDRKDHLLVMIDHRDDFSVAELMGQHSDDDRYEQVVSDEQQGLGSSENDWYDVSSQTMLFADSAGKFPNGQLASAYASSTVLFEEDPDEDVWLALVP